MAFVPFQSVANFENISTRNESAGGGFKVPVAGCYPVTVLDCGLDVRDGMTEEQAKSVSFHVQITEGDYAGFKTWINAGRDLTKLGNRITWKTALVSLGYDETSLTGEIGIDTQAYVGLNGYMKFTPKSPTPATEREQYDQREFVTPTYYQNALSAGTTQSVTTTAVAAPTTTATFKTATAAAAPKAAAPAPARAAAIPQPAAGAANKYAGFIAK